MSDDRAIEIAETEPPRDAHPWDVHGEPLDPNAATEAVPLPVPAPVPEQPPGPAPRRLRFVPRSLSSRLVAFVVALVVLVVAAAGSATYVALTSFLYDRLDQQVNTLADANSDSIQRCVDRNGLVAMCPLGGGSNIGAAQRQWITVMNSSGRAIARVSASSNAVKLMELSAGQARDAAGSGSAQTWTTRDGATLRVAARQVLLPGGDHVVVVSGLATADVSRTLHRLVWLEVAIGAAAVALALGLTTWGVHLSLRPLSRVTRTAQEVTEELSPEGAGLDRRVPEGDPQTEVGQLAESFNSLMGTVETQFAARVESEERMRQFLADASHELRTPLTSIRGYAELSRMRRAGGDAEHADTMDRIESEGTRMSRLVEDLLMLARSDQGTVPHREAVDVSDLIEEAVEGARAAYPRRRIDAAAPTALRILADHDQLLRVLRNLITNAAVHTAPDGPIRVSGEPHGDDIVLRVTDSGPGLPRDEAEHVFERFWRADKARSRARGGSGLGLAIVASIVNAHGGTVHFESTVERGSTVTVRLPVATAQ